MKITQTPTDQLKKAVMDAAVKAYKIAGYNVPTAKDLAEIVTLTAENMRKYFRNNDLNDIAQAFEKGALGDYGENNGLSVARFHQYMRAFNGNGTNQQPADEPETAAKQPPRDRVADAHSMVNSAYQEWLRRGYNLIPARIILSWLLADNKIPEFRRRKSDADRKAEAALSASFATHRAPFQKLSDYIKTNQATEADAILLEAFFEECKAAGLQTLY